MQFVITRADGHERPVSGYRYAAPKPGVARYDAARRAPAKLPPRVDLRPFMTAVENQGQTSSCVANAVAGAYEYLAKRHLGEEAYDVSRLFIYYNARDLGGSADEDGGSFIGDAIEGLKRYGACSERTWPFEESAVVERPSDDSFGEAASFLVEHAELVPTELDAWRSALAEGHPVIFGISLFRSFDAHRKKGLVPMPSASEASRASHGGHAMLCVGYSDKDRLFVVRNSWGDGWGDKGYCYIPYDYLMNAKFNSGDSWIIRQIDAIPADEETWGDDESFLPELDHELATMSDDAYAALLEAVGEVPLETRLALLFLRAAGADGEIGDDELTSAGQHLAAVHQQLGSELEPRRVLKQALRRLGEDALVEETITLFG
ncbi:MAG: C1 family peptidase, partial [Polyangiaceae bacterium]|nr:C1 family peptidase [Polyangiaceae bacterium]